MLTRERIFAYLQSSLFFWVSAAAAAVGFVAALAGLRRLRRRDARYFMLCLAALYFPVVFLWLAYPVRLHARYLSFAAPLFFVLLAGGFAVMKGSVLKKALVTFFAGVSLVGSLESIRIQTDPIHKEDFRGIVVYALSSAASGDALCGMAAQVQYYSRQLNLKPKAAYFPTIDGLSGDSARSFERIWVLDGANMHPEVMNSIRRELDKRMAALGFGLQGQPTHFGGDDSLTVLYIYRKHA